MNLKNFNVFYEPWPHIVFDDFLNNHQSKEIIREILEQPNYDDKVMINRNRIFKGSKNFFNILSKSQKMNEIYEYFNKLETFENLKIFFQKEKISWKLSESIAAFSKNGSGKQYDSILEKMIKFLANNNLIKTSMNLDLDFSVSGEGYVRGAHRDRETRVLNFLIYLNQCDEKDGGVFELYDNNFLDFNQQNQYPRFPNLDNVMVSKRIPPKAGKLIIFLSTPNSYHAASQFLSKSKQRFFIYGSYSLNKKVNWLK